MFSRLANNRGTLHWYFHANTFFQDLEGNGALLLVESLIIDLRAAVAYRSLGYISEEQVSTEPGHIERYNLKQSHILTKLFSLKFEARSTKYETNSNVPNLKFKTKDISSNFKLLLY